MQRCPRNSGSSFIGKEKNVTGTLDQWVVKARSSEILLNQFLSFRLRITSQIENTKSLLIFACFIGLGALVLLEKLHQQTRGYVPPGPVHHCLSPPPLRKETES